MSQDTSAQSVECAHDLCTNMRFSRSLNTPTIENIKMTICV